ncbi:hypothetical protein Tco_0973524 [Tanacetum coccineum]
MWEWRILLCMSEELLVLNEVKQRPPRVLCSKSVAAILGTRWHPRKPRWVFKQSEPSPGGQSIGARELDFQLVLQIKLIQKQVFGAWCC